MDDSKYDKEIQHNRRRTHAQAVKRRAGQLPKQAGGGCAIGDPNVDEHGVDIGCDVVHGQSVCR